MKHKIMKLFSGTHNKLFISVIAMLFAIVTSGIFILLSGYSPIEAFTTIFIGAFKGKAAIARTLVQATPLILSGLAFTVARKATLINLGVEGQLYLGALAAGVVGTIDMGMSGTIHIGIAILAGMLVGGLYAGIVGFMKVKFGSNEVIATIMLNSIAILIANYLVSAPLKATGSVIAQTQKIHVSFQLVKLISRSQLTIATILAILACILVKVVMDKTILGYKIKVVGLNTRAAEIAGINVGRIVMISMFISGAISGLAGATHVLGVDGRFIANFSPGFGFSGIAVATLAAGSPLGVILTGLVFGAIRSGSMMLDLKTDIPLTYADVVQALVILFVATPMLINEIFFKVRRIGRLKKYKKDKGGLVQ